MPKVEFSAIKERCRCGRVGLFPKYEDGLTELARVKDGAETLTSTRTPRNVRQHNLAWALAGKLADNLDGIHDKEDAMDLLKIKARHVRWLTDPATGKVWPKPLSIAFAALSQEAFSRIFNRMTWIVCNELVPGMDEEALRREVLEMVDGNLPERRAA